MRTNKQKQPEYRVWAGMKQRCTNPSNPRFPSYGGRGIKLCEPWLEFDNFLSDMGPRPKGTTLDRIDNNGDYEPRNCRWATSRVQSLNRRDNRLITAFGRTQTLCEWAKEVRINEATISYRIGRSRWPIERALSTPVSRLMPEEIRFIRASPAGPTELAKRFGVHPNTILYARRHGKKPCVQGGPHRCVNPRARND